MTQITFIERSGQRHTVNAEDGLSLMVAAVENQIPRLPSVCNGCCSCGTCHVVIEQNQRVKSPKYSGEAQVLSQLSKATDSSRLACQVLVSPDMAGLEVLVP